MKNIVILILALFFQSLQCQNADSNSCTDAKLDIQKKALKKIGDNILIENPVLEKITEHDNIEVNKGFKQRLDNFFYDFCDELLFDKSFERFSLIYWYNVKYNQYKCCVPAESEIIPPSFLDRNHESSKNIASTALYCLLQKNNITKGVLENGFTQASLNFPHSIESTQDDILLNEFIEKVNQTQKEAYRLRE